ncbi:calcineurin-like phosphoesterase [Diplogelasinospora grovesii]|uniref:Calcineurin-like phosphoesterase n=1 Tax=Diplogelasinospora grovesii TaxID=303347 RepID=A0AAN6NJN9_9PEZI|nr:calcineurin-like phosphoesterase [Diplogelasinospora grovesii]
MEVLKWLGLMRPNQWEPPTILDRLFLASPLSWAVSAAYSLLVKLRGRPFRAPGYPGRAIRVVCLSDTHDQTLPASEIPDGDLLIHCGDLTDSGTADDIQKQLDWLASLPHRYKVVISGNHDTYFDTSCRWSNDEKRVLDFKGIHYLENSGVQLEFKKAGGERRLNVYGSGWVPKCGPVHFAFQYDRSKNPWKDTIPEETDVLVTHTPPKHHLDLDLGCDYLLEEIWRVKPKLHVFGHVHWGHGREAVYFDECQRAYETFMFLAAAKQAEPRRAWTVCDVLLFPILAPIRWAGCGLWMDALKVVWHGVHNLLWKWIMAGPGSNNGGLMVNAAVMYGNTGKVRNRVSVVDL